MSNVKQKERRETERTATELLRPLPVEVAVDGVMVPGTVIPHDLSLQGIRGKWEWELPRTEQFAVALYLQKRVLLQAHLAWQRRLSDSTVLAGLSFVKPSTRAASALRGYLKSLGQSTRRRSSRTADILPVEMLIPGSDDSVTVIASDLSSEGLQVHIDFANQVPEQLTLLLPLTWEAPLELRARVCWKRVTPEGGCLAGLQFISAEEAATRRIQSYLDTVDELRRAAQNLAGLPH